MTLLLVVLVGGFAWYGGRKNGGGLRTLQGAAIGFGIWLVIGIIVLIAGGMTQNSCRESGYPSPGDPPCSDSDLAYYITHNGG